MCHHLKIGYHYPELFHLSNHVFYYYSFFTQILIVSLWQVKDVEKHLKIENSSNYCAMIQPAGRDSMMKEQWSKISGEDYGGQFDPDYFAYLILR